MFQDFTFKDGEKEKIRLEAIDAGSQNRPKETDAELDSTQDEIIQKIEAVLVQERDNVHKEVEEVEGKLKEIETFMELDLYEIIPNEAKFKINKVKMKLKADLIELKKVEIEKNREKRTFKAKNKLQRDVSYPESKILHWAIIFLAIFLESIANSYFFSKGSDLGLLGGVFQALLISGANIGISLFMGVYVLPYKNHIEATKKTASTGTMSIYGFLIALFNLATAHYRSQLEIDPFNALINTIPKLLQSPFGIDNYESWVLFGIGLLFAVFALLKGYTSDDLYPGYGKIDRDCKTAKQEYDDLKNKLRYKINDIIDEHINKKLNELIIKINQNYIEYTMSVIKIEKLINHFKEYAVRAESYCYKMLKLYRQENKNVRDKNSPCPSYFSQRYCFNDDYKKITEIDIKEKKDTSEYFKKKIRTITNEAKNIQEELHGINKISLDELKKFFDEIEIEAEKIIESEAKENKSDAKI